MNGFARFAAGAAVLAGLYAPTAWAAPMVIEGRAINRSKTLEGRHAMRHSEAPVQEEAAPEAIVLGDVTLSLLVTDPGGTPSAREARTDADGRFRFEVDAPPDGTRMLLIGRDASHAEGGTLYYARPLTAGGAPPPAAMDFYRVAHEATGLTCSLFQVATVEPGKDGRDTVRLRQHVEVGNFSFSVWVGAQKGDRPASFHVPVPEGFSVVEVHLNGERFDDAEVVRVHDGQGIPFEDPIFPTFSEADGGYAFTTVLERPYQKGEDLDLGFHPEFPVYGYEVALEEDRLTYLPPAAGNEDVALEDKGPGKRATEGPATRTWVAEGIPAHTDMQVHVRMGPRPIATGPILGIAGIVFIVVGALVLGLWSGARGRTPAAATGGAKAGDVRVELERLQRRLDRGEMTSVEYETRRRALLGPAAPSNRAPDAAPPSRSSDRRRLITTLEAIARRPDDAPAAERAEDLRVLARAVKEILEG